jgi:pimeloyl-ACP methyl ester carboxylesterase
MKTLVLLVTGAVLAFGACSSSSDPEPSAGMSPAPSAEETDPLRGMVDIGSRSLRLDCVGDGPPTLVAEAGDGVPRDVLGDVLVDAFADRMRVCSYDRANTGQSDVGASLPRRAPEVFSDLHDLLATAEVPGPYVLVGNSAGGMFVQGFARTYPDDVAGVVAMNPVPPWEQWSRLAFPSMTPAERRGETAYFGGEGSAEGFDYRQLSARTAAAPEPPGVPLHLLVATVAQCDSPGDICGRSYPAYVAIMERLAAGWPEGRFTRAGSGHELYLTDPRVVVAAIEDVLARAAQRG